jgi:NADH:ubiquinone oxidoreductase subunit 4 (subunit M)
VVCPTVPYFPVGNSVVAEAQDLRRRELWVALVFTALILLGGLYSSMVLDATREAAALWVARLGPPAL